LPQAANCNNRRRFKTIEFMRQLIDRKSKSSNNHQHDLFPFQNGTIIILAPSRGMRHLIFNAKKNGFADAFKRVGRRVLVDEAEFFAAVDRQNQRGA